MTTSHLNTGVEPTPENNTYSNYTADNGQCPTKYSYSLVEQPEASTLI
jgi:hypothetical protein